MKYIKGLILMVVLIGSGCTHSYKEVTGDYFYFDTYINLRIYTKDKQRGLDALKEVVKIYEDYHQLADQFHAYPGVVNVYELNHGLALNQWVTLDKRLYDLISYGVQVYEESHGLVNIALGNVLGVWHDYRTKGVKVPTREELINSGSTAINEIELGSNNTFRKRSLLQLDLGAIAKGYVTEIVGQHLEALGLPYYLINAGGNVKVGLHVKNKKYKIGLEDPLLEGNIYGVVKGVKLAVVTSGGYERYYEVDGVKYHHIIDPESLFPPHYMEAVTVVGPDSGRADTLTTMLFLMPITSGLDYLNTIDGYEAVWTDLNGVKYYSKGFKQYEEG